MLCAYRCIWLPFEFFGHRVRTAQMKRVCLEQFIPQLFKLNSGLYPSFSTKNPNSFPKHYNSLVLNLSAPRFSPTLRQLANLPLPELCFVNLKGRLWVLLDFPMHRLTARFLLTLMLVGIVTPVALAISAPAPHACCIRKPMHDHATRSREFNAPPTCCSHDCCHALTVTQSPYLLPPVTTQVAIFSVPLQVGQRAANRSCLIPSTHCGRAPPQFFIA